ncbi:MAG: C40 family peptidase [Bacillota bacterium]
MILIYKLYLIIILSSIVLIISGCSDNIKEKTVDITRREKALEVAINQEGTPYVWGARGPDYFDCSGLITYSYKSAYERKNIFNIDSWITSDATMQDLYNWNVDLKSLSKIEPGDIIFMTREEGKITHGGLFIEWKEKYDKFKFVHASSTAEKVVREIWHIGNMNTSLKFVNAGRFKASY